MSGSHRTSLRQIRKACAQEGHHWQSWDRWTDYCTHCSLRIVRDTKRCIVHDETYTTVCRGCRADEIAASEETA